jgi:hypothetical protein
MVAPARRRHQQRAIESLRRLIYVHWMDAQDMLGKLLVRSRRTREHDHAIPLIEQPTFLDD